MSLFEIAKTNYSGNRSTKPLCYYKKYDDFISHHKLSPTSILEVGVYAGESTKILSRRFPNAKILALDLQLQPIDFSEYPNVVYLQADQTDQKGLQQIIQTHFPEGVDLVIEDACHYGWHSKTTFDIVFPFVKDGGAYFVEDWGTGYWNFFPDGNTYNGTSIISDQHNKTRIVSHDYGMVGFVKSLVDMTHESAIINEPNSDIAFQTIETYTSRIRVLEFGEGVCMLVKGRN